jgi:uncharacterized repeat protein (TIGR03803 family)
MKRRLGKIAAAFLVLVLCRGTTTRAQAQTFTVLHTFTDSPDGAVPFAELFRDTAGNLYGTTHGGGCTIYGCGTVFKLDPVGNETVLYRFGSVPSGLDPQGPYAAPVMDTAGNLYGTTRDSGAFGGGTVFRLDTSGNLTVLHSFSPAGADGASPYAGLVLDTAGNLYGTATTSVLAPYGTVFKIDTADNFMVLHTFTGADGAGPAGDLIIAAGNLYGTTGGGGSGACPDLAGFVAPCGTVFKVDITSGNATVLYSFKRGSDGGNPLAGLLMDGATNLYGTTITGGSGTSGTCSGETGLPGCGTVFKLDASGNETVLYSFKGGSDGALPYAGLVMDALGNLYGTTSEGGPGACTGRNQVVVGCGIVFKLDPAGNETVLHSFTGGSDGAFPLYGHLVMDTTGNLYGTASSGGFGTTNAGGPCTVVGGLGGCGTVFKLTVQTPAPTITSISPTSVIAGGPAPTLIVNGTNFVNGSTVNFNGNALTTTFVSATQLTAALLASDIAIVGNFNVTVTNPGGTTSNPASFTVNNPVPTITSISPTSAIAGGAAFTLTVNGANFVSGSTVSINGNARTTTFVSATQLTAAILASDIATAGSLNVMVTNPAPGGGTSNAVSFTVQTLQQATQAIVGAVNALFAQGVLNGGQHNSLVTQLQHAINMMNAGKNAGAIGNLESFVGEVNDLLSSGVLSSSQAAALINAAQIVIARLS